MVFLSDSLGGVFDLKTRFEKALRRQQPEEPEREEGENHDKESGLVVEWFSSLTEFACWEVWYRPLEPHCETL